MRKLIILDLKKNFHNIFRNSCSYINIGRGSISIKNSLEINLKKMFKKNERRFMSYYFKNLKINQKKWDDLFDEEKFEELEFLNLRNDKYNYLNKFINIFCIKNFIKKEKFTNIEVISDQLLYKDLFKSLHPKIKCYFPNESLISNKLSFFFFRTCVKFFQNLFLVFIIKIIFFSNKITKPNLYLTMYPRFFSKGKDYFYKKKFYCNLNISLSDGIFIHNNFFENLKKILEIRFVKKIIPIEKYISLKDVCKTYIKLIFNFYKAKNRFSNEMKIGNLNFTTITNKYLLDSFAQRLFLNIYSESLKKILKKNIKQFHLYCFEYSIGFYLIRKIKTINPLVKIFGYQHGVFTDKLLWFDFIKKSQNKNLYLVDKIYSQNLFSLKSYSKLNLVKNINLIAKQKGQYELQINKNITNKIKYNVLVILGRHDAYDILYSLDYFLSQNPNKQIFFFVKPHPQMIPDIKSLFSNKIKLVSSFNGNYDLILCSDTTTVSYDLMHLKIDFKIIELDNRNNLFFSNFKNNLSINKIINKI